MTNFDNTARELGGGNWFILSTVLGIVLIIYFMRELQSKGNREQRWLAIALAMICFGSSIRAFLTWMLNIYTIQGWPTAQWTRTWPWFMISVSLNSIGSLIGIWVLLPLRFKKCVVAVTLVACIGIPLAMFYYI